MTPTHITNFFSIVNTKIKLVEEVRKHFGKETSPRFNSFDFWWIDENKVSEILAFFLNPNENHEQGDIYLTHFINKFELNHFTYKEGDDIKVTCELYTNNGRFIDIVIFNNRHRSAIGIENKINKSTKDQFNQLTDYNRYLSKLTSDNYSLIYLSPLGKVVSEDSMSKSEQELLLKQDRFKCLTYEEHIIECVSEFAMMTESIRVRSFLKDFEKTLRRRFMGEKDMEAKEAIIEMVKESDKNLEISCLVYNSWIEMQEQFKELLKEQVLDLKIELNLELVERDDNRVWLKPKRWKKHFFGYSFEGGHVFYGITQHYPECKTEGYKFTEAINYMNDKLNGGFEYSRYWPIYKYLNMHIVNSPDFCIAVKNGTAKEEIKNFIKVLIEKYETDDEFYLG